MLQKLFLSLICFVVTAIPVVAQNTPEACYLVGSYNNWTTPDQTDLSTLHTLTDEDADGIYYGKFNLAAGQFDFKVFTAVTNWNDGIKYFGANKEISLATINTEKFQAVFEGSHNITCPDWDGGEIEMYYDFVNNQFWFEVERPCVYMNIVELSNPDDVASKPILFQTEKENCYATTINFSASEIISFNFMSDLDFTQVYAPKNNTEVEFEINSDGAQFEGAFMTTENKKNLWTIKDFPGGKITFVVDTEAEMMSISYKIAKPDNCIYVVGSISGWIEPSEAHFDHYQDFALVPEGNDIYSGTFNINAGELMFRIYSKLTGWDGGDSYGSQVDDNPIDAELINGEFTSEMVKGKGSWNILNWVGGKAEIRVDMQAMTITLKEVVDKPVEEEFISLSTPEVSDITETSAKINFTVTTSENLLGNYAVIYINDEGIGYFPIESTITQVEHTFDGLEPGETKNVSIFVAVGELMSNTEYVSFTTTGINDIDVDTDAAAEYFNMQGVSVSNPENGLYIRRQGNKTEKIFLK